MDQRSLAESRRQGVDYGTSLLLACVLRGILIRRRRSEYNKEIQGKGFGKGYSEHLQQGHEAIQLESIA